MTTDPNLKVQIDPNLRVIELRQSAIQSFLNCPRRFYWEYVMGLEPDYPGGLRPWRTVDTGTAFHKAMEAYYTSADPLDAIDGWMIEEFGEIHPDADLDLLRIMVEGHIDDLMSEGADVGERTIEVEIPLAVEIENVAGWKVIVHGQIDRLIETDDGLRIIDDWKTVGPLSGSALTHIQQLGRYMIMARQQLDFRADRLRVTEVRKVKRTKGGPFYGRPWVPTNETMFRDHAHFLRRDLTNIVRQLTADRSLIATPERNDWSFNVTGECDWKCRVQDICLAQQHGDDPELIVDIHYRPKEAQ